MVRVPAVEICHHRYGRVAKLRLPCQLRLRHVGHADDAASPRPVKLALRLGGELRSLHHQIGAAADNRNVSRSRGAFQHIAQPGAHRMRHGDMRDYSLSEKTLLAREATVDELIDDDEM